MEYMGPYTKVVFAWNRSHKTFNKEGIPVALNYIQLLLVVGWRAYPMRLEGEFHEDGVIPIERPGAWNLLHRQDTTRLCVWEKIPPAIANLEK